MKLNVGKWDRLLRIAGGAILLTLWFFDPANLVWLIGLVPLLTGAFGFCPAYRLAGFSTCARTSRAKGA